MTLSSNKLFFHDNVNFAINIKYKLVFWTYTFFFFFLLKNVFYFKKHWLSNNKYFLVKILILSFIKIKYIFLEPFYIQYIIVSLVSILLPRTPSTSECTGVTWNVLSLPSVFFCVIINLGHYSFFVNQLTNVSSNHCTHIFHHLPVKT